MRSNGLPVDNRTCPPPQVEDEAEPGLLFPDDVRSVQRNILRAGKETHKDL